MYKKKDNYYDLKKIKESVHTENVKQELKDSVFNLMEQINTKNYDDGVHDSEYHFVQYCNFFDDEMSNQCKKILIEYSSDVTIYEQLKCNFSEILMAVVFETKCMSKNLQLHVKNKLNEEMTGNHCESFVERIDKLIRCLSGTSNKVVV